MSTTCTAAWTIVFDFTCRSRSTRSSGTLATPTFGSFVATRAWLSATTDPAPRCLEGDTLYQHATARGLPHALIELRQDLVGSAEGARDWARRTGDGLAELIADPTIRRIEHHGSRAGA